MRIADLSQIDRSTAIYHIAFTVLNGVFNYTALYCLNYHILCFHRLIMPLENFFENFFRNFAKTAPSIRDRSERGRKPTSRCMRGGEQLLELTPSQKKTVRHQFDSFCRKVLREEARDYERHIAWRSNHEVSLSELSEEQERQMYVLDEYPSEQTHFHVRGYDVAIENEDLANALTVLPDDKRDIVLLAYFLDMTDQEIADKLDMVRRTVQYKRAQSLKELKKWRLRKMARNLSNTAASLLPYSTIEAAASGNVDAINAVLKHYERYIAALATRTLYDENGVPHLCLDEEKVCRMRTKLITKILDFKVNKTA